MQTINVVYGGEDTRSLQYQSDKPVSVSGDNNSTTLHFIFPEGYTEYDKTVIFDVRIYDEDANFVYAQYPLDANDDLLLPIELTQAGKGKTVQFKLKMTGQQYTEQSLGLAITFSRM